MTEEKRPTLEEIRARIGEKREEVVEVDKSMIRAFCQCIEDPNPRWQDVAPPGFLTTVKMSGGAVAIDIPEPYKRKVAAGGEWEFYKPIKPGDIITTSHEFSDIQDKSSEKGKRALMIFKSTHKNQKGEVVAVTTGTTMSY